MKLASAVLSMFIVLFTIIVAGCESATGGGSSGKDQDTLDQCPSGNCSADTAVGEESPFDSAQGDNKETGYCGDGVCGIFEDDTPENCLSCLEDCPCSLGLVCNDVGTCGADPLADYYWLDGQWKRESIDGKPNGLIVDVTVEAWDDELGAEVHGFQPMNVNYIKKNVGTNEFLFDVKYDSSTYAKGSADKNTLTFEFDFCTPCNHVIYKKL